MADMTVQVTLRLRDQVGSAVVRALSAVRGETAKATEASKGLARATATVGTEAARAAESSRGLAKATAEVGKANLGGLVGNLRQADKLARSTAKGFADMARAGGQAYQVLAKAGAAVAAGGWVASRALAAPVAFERRLALMSNTAFSDRDAAGRRAGMGQLRGSVDRAVRLGGGTRDSAAEALDQMLASGAVQGDAAMSMLPTIQKFATGSGASSTDIAGILIRGVQNKFFKPEEAEAALDKALAAGQMGGFELKDMARWLPQLMASARGMRGMAGYERLLASAQASATTAGTKDEAGNNLVNLLAKITSQDTAKDFAKLGIDLPGSLSKAAGKGVSTLDAFVNLVESRVVGKDKSFDAARAKAASATGADRQEAMSNAADVLQGTAIGKVIQDRQALMALTAELTQRDYVKQVMGGMAGAGGAGATAFSVVAGTTSYKAEQAAAEQGMAASKMLDDLGGPLNQVMDTAIDLAREFPALTTAVSEAATAIGAMSAAAAAVGGYSLLTGAAGAGVAGGVLGAGRAALGGAGKLGIPALALGAAALDIYGIESSGASRAQKNRALAGEAVGAVGSGLGSWGGMTGGAALGSMVFPGPGTAIGGAAGALAGGLLGWWGGKSLGQSAGQLVFKDESKITVESHLNVDGRELAKSVNEVNAREAGRH